MTPPRSLETRDSAPGSEVNKPARPLNMIPRLSGVKPKEETKLLLLDLAEHLHPGVDDFGKLNKQDRSHWILLASGILREYPDISQYLDTLSEVLARGVNAEIDDILQRLDSDLQEKARRSEEEEHERGKQQQRDEESHQESLVDQQQQRKQRNQEWDIRKEILEQNRDRKKQQDENGRVLELIFTSMSIVSFVLAICLLAAGVILGHTNGQALTLTSPGLTLAIGGAGATGLLSLTLLALHRLRSERTEPETASLSPPPTGGETAPTSLSSAFKPKDRGD